MNGVKPARGPRCARGAGVTVDALASMEHLFVLYVIMRNVHVHAARVAHVLGTCALISAPLAWPVGVASCELRALFKSFEALLYGKLEPPEASLKIPRGSSSAATRSKSASPGITDAM